MNEVQYSIKKQSNRMLRKGKKTKSRRRETEEVELYATGER